MSLGKVQQCETFSAAMLLTRAVAVTAFMVLSADKSIEYSSPCHMKIGENTISPADTTSGPSVAEQEPVQHSC